MRCAIVQPSYVPWRGYFDLIRRVDIFVFYDDVQYDRRGWRNRNRIKTADGSRWLTIPVHARGAQIESIAIRDIMTVNNGWPRRHHQSLLRSYARAPHFGRYREWLKEIYAAPPRRLADFTIPLTIEIAGMLGITGVRFVRSSGLHAAGRKSKRLIDILQEVGANHYLSGPSARAYIDEQEFVNAGVELEWMNYDYPKYAQLYGPFDPNVSILDLLFMTGEQAADFIWPRVARLNLLR